MPSLTLPAPVPSDRADPGPGQAQVRIHYAEHGRGVPVVVLHGAGSDHRETEAALEPLLPRTGYRRVYLDLPGMGHSTADGLTGHADVVAVLCDAVERLVGEPVLLIGHSYGGLVARTMAAARPALVRGLLLVCPLAQRTGAVPEHRVVHEEPGARALLSPDQVAGFEEYFVVRTRATARRYRDCIAPAAALVDEAALGRIFSQWSVDLGPGGMPCPTTIVAGRQDSTVGYADSLELLERYPHATVTVVDGAGHALIHERPRLLAALVEDWLCSGVEGD